MAIRGDQCIMCWATCPRVSDLCATCFAACEFLLAVAQWAGRTAASSAVRRLMLAPRDCAQGAIDIQVWQSGMSTAGAERWQTGPCIWRVSAEDLQEASRLLLVHGSGQNCVSCLSCGKQLQLHLPAGEWSNRLSATLPCVKMCSWCLWCQKYVLLSYDALLELSQQRLRHQD